MVVCERRFEPLFLDVPIVGGSNDGRLQNFEPRVIAQVEIKRLLHPLIDLAVDNRVEARLERVTR